MIQNPKCLQRKGIADTVQHDIIIGSTSMPQTSIGIRVPFHDVHSTGRIHFTAIFRSIEIAEHELRRSIGFPEATSFKDRAFPRVHVECDFRGAIRYDDELTVEARVDRVRHSSWTVANIVCITQEAGKIEQQGVSPLVAEGYMTMVAMDQRTERAIPLPEALRSALVSS
jgi:acyl-CoA thioester hydrolase